MCWFSMAKLFMFVFNFALFAAGAAVLGVGIWIYDNGQSTTEVLGTSLSQNGAIVLMTAGGLALTMGFLGCCGAKKESTGLLGLYFFLLLIIVILQIAVGIWAAVNFDSVDEFVAQGFDTFDLNKPGAVSTMDNLAKEFRCCGTNDTCSDLDNYNLSCNCTSGSQNCAVNPSCGIGYPIYDQTCNTAISNYMDENMKIIAGIGIAIGCVEIVGLIFSWCMCQAIKEHKGYA